MKPLFCSIFFLVIAPFLSFSQKNAKKYLFNLNESNGLPSNHVYGTIEDQLGYLWISTDKGVVKYNGYECRVFNENDGIAKSDIFQTFEDSTGKIWLGSMSSEMGYIFQDEYHKVKFFDVKQNKSISPNMVFPTEFKCWGKNVAFTSPYVGDKGQPALCITSLDTVFVYSPPDSIFKKYFHEYSVSKWKINNNQTAVYILDENFFSFSRNSVVPKFQFLYTASDIDRISNLIDFGRYWLCFEEHSSLGSLDVFDVKTGLNRKINLKLDDPLFERIEKLNDSEAQIFSKKFVYKFNINCGKIVQKHNFSDFDSVQKTNLWSFEVLKGEKGFNLRPYLSSQFKHQNFELENFNFVGNGKNGAILWSKNDSFALFDKNNKLIYKIFNGIKKPGTVTHLKRDSFLVLSKSKGCFLWETDKRKFSVFNATLSGDAIVLDSANNYWLTTAVGLRRGHLKANLKKDAGTIKGLLNLSTEEIPDKKIDETRFHSLIIDNQKKEVYAASLNSVVIVHNDRVERLPLQFMEKEGIKFIKKLLFDSLSKTFILQTFNKLFLYKPIEGEVKEIFAEYKLDDAVVRINKNKIFCAIPGGLAFCTIAGENKVENYQSIPNPKGIFYRSVFDFSVGDSNILINTDQSIYLVNFLQSNQETTTKGTLRFYYLYKKTPFEFKTSDTTIFDHKDLNLKFDVVNPNGIGHLSLTYFLKGKKYVSKNCEVNLNGLITPGEYTDLKIVFNDDAWKSEPKVLKVYLTPLWWEAIVYSKFVWVWLTLLLVILLIPTALLTRKWVNRINARKTLNQDIEIKSIYSQINPHFIFNSLNTALYLISERKNESAFNHVSRFSKLLRAYLSSSRNKFISLADEIENITNYVQLQQIRFTDLFEFKLIVDDNLSTSNIKIPSLILQPLVENAINHGLFHLKDRKGTLTCEFKSDASGKGLVCIVDDDGVGRAFAKSIAENSLIKKESFGSMLINDLITIFNKYEKMGISIAYFDKEAPAHGTKVVLTIAHPKTN